MKIDPQNAVSPSPPTTFRPDTDARSRSGETAGYRVKEEGDEWEEKEALFLSDAARARHGHEVENASIMRDPMVVQAVASQVLSVLRERPRDAFRAQANSTPEAGLRLLSE